VPNAVVFDEAHFGKFTAHYMRGSYVFDIHPPLGKMTFAFFGWLLK
jgi:dolichyl-phosphate-mannose-protein mannosyltransferase